MRTLILAGVLLMLTPLLSAGPKSDLPRFTEEREAAALFFVKKHLPELLPLLADLKKSSPADYQREVREIFHETEMLADLDDPKRHELELKVWKAANRSHVLVGRMRSAGEDEKKKLQEQLKELARELVELDIQVLEAQADQLDKELGEVKDELARARDEKEQNVKARYEGFLEKSRKPKK